MYIYLYMLLRKWKRWAMFRITESVGNPRDLRKGKKLSHVLRAENSLRNAARIRTRFICVSMDLSSTVLG